MDQFNTQIRVMQQSNAMQETIQDLYRWEKEMKQKENLSHQTAVTSEPFDSEFPIRSHVAPDSPTMAPTEPNTSQNAATNGLSSSKKPATIVKTTSTLEKANEFKTRGNDCVKSGQFQKAIHYYTEAIRLNKFDPIYFSNRAHCYLKLNRFLECVEDCTIAIGLDENCVKAYYRRMQAHEKLEGNLTAALSDCKAVLRFEPKNSEAKKSLERIEAEVKKMTPPAAAVSKSQIENQNILLRASNSGGPAATQVPPATSKAAPWSKYEGQNDYEKIDFISKPPHLRSKETLKRIKITETSPSTANGGGDAPLIEEIHSASHDEPQVQKVPNESIPEETTKTAAKLPIHPGPSGDSNRASKSAEVNAGATVPHPPPQTPKSPAQFHKIWSAANSNLQKYAILKSIYNGDVAKLLGSQFEVEHLSEILMILKHHFVPEKRPIVNIMHGIVNNTGISIIALLMSDEDKLSFSKLLAYMRSIGEDASRIDAIEKKFESFLLS